MLPPEKVKHKLLTPDADEDRRTGVTLYALSTILRMEGPLKYKPGNIRMTTHSLPRVPNDEKMKNKQWQIKHHKYNYQSMHKEALQQRNF